MDDKITFKAEIEFTGTIEKFQEVAATLADLPVRIRVPHWPPGHTIAGCWPLPIREIVSDDLLERLQKTGQIVEVPPKFICRTSCGGITMPHLHIADDKIALIDQAAFTELVGEAAKELGQKLAQRAEYAETVGAVRGLVPGAK